MAIMTFGNSQAQAAVCGVVRVGLSRNDNVFQQVTAVTVPTICEQPPLEAYVEQIEHLKTLDLVKTPCSGSQYTKPDLLIGIDHFWDIVTGEVLRGPTGPIALKTDPVAGTEEVTCSTNLAVTTTSLETTRRIERQLRNLWELESLGIQGKDCSLYELCNLSQWTIRSYVTLEGPIHKTPRQLPVGIEKTAQFVTKTS